MSKLPAFQFYPGDWRKDPGVQALTFHDRGVWFEILCLLHESEDRGKLLLNGKPMPDDALARLLGLDKQILTKTLTNLIDYGVASRCPETGALMSRRMVRDEEIRRKRQEAGKKGGNPALKGNLLKQNSTTQVKQKSTPSSSSSISSSSSEVLKEKQEKERRGVEPEIPDFEDECTDGTDWITAEHEFMTQWNSTDGAISRMRNVVPQDLKREFRERWRDPHWRKLYPKALARFPLKCGVRLTLEKFLKDSTVEDIIGGKYDFRKDSRSRDDRVGAGQSYDPAATAAIPTVGGF